MTTDTQTSYHTIPFEGIIGMDFGTTNSGIAVPLADGKLEILPIDPANAIKGTPFTFKPTHAGKHILTFSGSDRSGRPFRTSITQRVYGSKEYPWAYENGMLIKLIPEKKSYKPGETARILVQREGHKGSAKAPARKW